MIKSDASERSPMAGSQYLSTSGKVSSSCGASPNITHKPAIASFIMYLRTRWFVFTSNQRTTSAARRIHMTRHTMQRCLRWTWKQSNVIKSSLLQASNCAHRRTHSWINSCVQSTHFFSITKKNTFLLLHRCTCPLSAILPTKA